MVPKLGLGCPSVQVWLGHAQGQPRYLPLLANAAPIPIGLKRAQRVWGGQPLLVHGYEAFGCLAGAKKGYRSVTKLHGFVPQKGGGGAGRGKMRLVPSTIPC